MPLSTIVAGLLADVLAVPGNRPLGDLALVNVEQAGDRPGGCGLAGAVGAEQRNDLAVRHLDRQAAQHEDDLVVDHF